MQDETGAGDKSAALSSGWRKPSYSMSNSHCVEVACLDILRAPAGRRIAVRDTKAAGAGPELLFDARIWTAFLTEIRVPSSFRI